MMMKSIGFHAAGIARARKKGAERMRRSPVALSYSARRDTLNITMPSGTVVIIPRLWITEIADLPKAAMKKIYLTKWRGAYHIDDPDSQISSMGLLRHAVVA